jgi:site-specific DNA-methyltransferase (adenine-specific)
MIPPQTVDLVITSPPYFQQRDYDQGGIGNEATIESYLDTLLNIFDECVRITKPTGSIVFNVGDKYLDASLQLIPYRFAISASARGVKLVNQVTWVKSNPTPRQFKRRMVSSTEPFFHFVKTSDYFYNLDAFMRSSEPKPRETGSTGQNIGKTYFQLIEQSELTVDQKQRAKDALTQVIEETQRGEIQSFRMKIRGLHAEPFGGQGGGRKAQLDRNGFTIIRIYGEPLKRDVIETPVETLKGTSHPAIYPTRIVEEFLALLTQPNSVVLDPFIGSGSTAVAAAKMGRAYIGFDISENYCQFARDRLVELDRQPHLFRMNAHYL